MGREHPTIVQMPIGADRADLVTRDLAFDAYRTGMDPFLVVSLFDMRASVFPPHPHAGFSVATYIFPESEVGFQTQDTLGDVTAISPGAFHLTVAGSGVLHEETVSRTGRSATGLQIWIDHAAHDRVTEPRALHLAAADVPIVIDGGVVRRVLLGAPGGAASPVDAPVSATVVDVDLAQGAVFQEQVGDGESAFAVIRSGVVETTDGTAAAGDAVFPNNGAVSLRSTKTARVTFFRGRALRQNLVPAGPFVASDQAQADEFRRRFASGAMGRLRPFNQPVIDSEFDRALSGAGSRPV